MSVRRLIFPCGDLSLEGVLRLPERTPAMGGVVVCHPHPLYGGDMDNNVVMPVCDALERAGIAALRFNFRGVSGSDGSFADGVGEQEDVAAAITFLSGEEDIGEAPIGLCGYSFGAGVAFAQACRDDRVRAFAGISIQASSVDPEACYVGPKLLITGSRDLLTPAKEAQDLAGRLCEPKEFRMVLGADHFWLGQEEELAGIVADFFLKALQDQVAARQ